MSAWENPLPAFRVDQYHLSNGLAVLLLEDHARPLVAVNVNYRVGSKNEQAGRTGFAHLFEHMMFQGSKHFNDDYFKALQDIGGVVNGGTSTDRTRYWEVVPAPYLERALWLEADRMGFLLHAVSEERLANTISVVQNERRQNYENRPYGLVHEKMAALLYPPHHPYSWPTIGHLADLEKATLADVKEVFHAFYPPNNASLCLVGDFEPARARELVARYFGSIPPGPPVTRLERWVPGLEGEIALEIQDRVQLPRSYFAWPTVPRFCGDEAALDLFARILGQGQASRLYRRLVWDRQAAQDAVTAHTTQEIAGQFQLLLTPRPGHGQAEVEQAALAVLSETLDQGVTAAELGRAQNATVAECVRGIQSIGGFGGLADKLNEYYHYLGQPDMFRWDLQRYLDQTPETVTAVARRYLRGGRLVARVVPLPVLQAAAGEASLDRARIPGPGPEKPFRLPERRSLELPNGLRVVLVEEHKVPLVSFNLVVRGGGATDPPGLAGLASLTAEMLTEGAGGRTALQLAEALEEIGAEVEASAGKDSVTVCLSALKTHLDMALELYADVIGRPDFPADELERQRRRRLVQLRQLQDQPRYLAGLAADRALFGAHAYGRPLGGTLGSVAKITRPDLLEFWQSRFVPANAVLVAAGDITPVELETALTRSLAHWPAGPAPALGLPAPEPPRGRVIFLVDKPGAAQSNIVVAMPGAARTDPGHALLELLNRALGGQFVSRINLNLREDKGYTYGANSRFISGLVPGAFAVSAPVDTAVTVPALRELMTELEGVAGSRPLTVAEIEFARGSLVNGYARRFETAEQIVCELAETYLYGLPDNAPEDFPAQVAAATPGAVGRIARERVCPDRAVVVVVGDGSRVQPELERCNLGSVVLLDVNTLLETEGVLPW